MPPEHNKIIISSPEQLGPPVQPEIPTSSHESRQSYTESIIHRAETVSVEDTSSASGSRISFDVKKCLVPHRRIFYRN